ncbi:hypothetical protein ONS95_004440 [Cadophora gregata]|uniref:uncharacterized protein n=1 Tax=Cadophora gregata TaxID=51156 RepID=UPI0026DC608A|nr:uncharacterized protein ONS95_004440 [Cadophora gregata]KAK0105162.1 hypothetical protein ONS96_004563 [Cadophora gregata f. sp. sojae]KAK0105927.1 hypothetical protein ONS95_004440 [Cadophora gregata]
MGMFSWQSQHSLGRHTDTVSAAHMIIHRKGNLIYSTVGAVLGLHLVKVSICFLLMRFVSGRGYRIVLWSIVGFLIAFTIACWGTLIFWCLPVKAFWDVSLRRLPTTHCYPQIHFTNISLMNTAINMFTEVLLATLPVHIIWNLQINRRQKASLIGVLSLGYAAVGLGVAKAIKQVQLPTDKDVTWSQGVQLWGYVQLNVSIIASCMPALRPLFSWLSDAVSSGHRTRDPAGSHRNPRSGYFRQYDSSGSVPKGTSGSATCSFGGENKESDVPLCDLEANGGVGRSAFVSANVSQRTEGERSWIDTIDDSESEKDILHMNVHGSKGIVRTTAFTVKTDSSRDQRVV